MKLLELSNINQYYGGSHILRNVSISAEMGKITVLLGRNGVGKTTLLKSLMGLIPIRSGTMSLNGMQIESISCDQRARAGIGFVPQGREIFNRLSVQDNLRMGLAAKYLRNYLSFSQCSNKCYFAKGGTSPVDNSNNWQ